MAVSPFTPDALARADSPGPSLEKRLERGEVIYYPVCPFPLPQGPDRQFLLAQRLASRAHKNISYDPSRLKAGGFANESPEQAQRLRCMLAEFSENVTRWTSDTLPRYARYWRLDMVSYRPEEESTRQIRHKARNDLLHVDAFPSRPTNGARILRVFANVNLTEPRVWATSDPFARLLERFGKEVGLPTSTTPGFVEHLRESMLRIFKPGRPQRSTYDRFMLRFHDFLKANESFQEHGPKKLWTFLPGSAWLAFTDTCSHSVLRGRYALEHSYFVAPEGLQLPDESPAALLEKACGLPVLHEAA
jgi:hypothetical protein